MKTKKETTANMKKSKTHIYLNPHKKNENKNENENTHAKKNEHDKWNEKGHEK